MARVEARFTRIRPSGGAISSGRTLGLAFVLLAAASGLEGQVVQGRVLDARTGEPIATARVTLLDEEGERVWTTLANGSGDFALDTDGPGQYRLEADRLGYGVQRGEPFDVGPADLTRQDIQLVPEAVQIEGIVVESYPGELLHSASLSGVYARRARSPSVGSNRVLVRGDPEFREGALHGLRA